IHKGLKIHGARTGKGLISRRFSEAPGTVTIVLPSGTGTEDPMAERTPDEVDALVAESDEKHDAATAERRAAREEARRVGEFYEAVSALERGVESLPEAARAFFAIAEKARVLALPLGPASDDPDMALAAKAAAGNEAEALAILEKRPERIFSAMVG